MFATKSLKQAAHAAAHSERTPLIKFIGKRSIPSSIDHTPHAHPAAPSQELPKSFSHYNSFSDYRQSAQQHGPLGVSAARGVIGGSSGSSLGPVSPAKGQYFDRNELPLRFRRKPYDPIEIEAIQTGGATLVC